MRFSSSRRARVLRFGCYGVAAAALLAFVVAGPDAGSVRTVGVIRDLRPVSGANDAPPPPEPAGSRDAGLPGGGSPPGGAGLPGAALPESAALTGRADAGASEMQARLANQTPVVVWYSFDGGPIRGLVDNAGRYALRPTGAAGGTVSLVPRNAGYALRFPARCSLSPNRCPRAILESTQADLFNTGTRPVRFGALVLMTTADTGPGANVVQKGFSVGGGTQFKLQVDGAPGQPSCVLANGRSIYRLTAPVSVADGRWHSVVCTRVGGQMAIAVDGSAISRHVPAGLSIRNSEPLRIGGKGTGPGNDQFAGRIDDVFVAMY